MRPMGDAIERDQRGPDVAARVASEREDRTRAGNVQLAESRLHANDEEARTITHACESVPIASLFDGDVTVARELRAALPAVRRESIGHAPAQRRSPVSSALVGPRGGHGRGLSRALCHDPDRAISRA